MTQRSLTALRIGNFKAFADIQRIPLKPITLIFGPNSAGKSSLIQSIAFAHQAQLGRNLRGGSALDVHFTEIGGKSIDLGGFRQFVHQRKANRRVTWGVEIAVDSLGGRLRELLQEVKQLAVTVTIGIELDDQDRAKPGAAPRVESFEISADGKELLSGSARRGGIDNTVMRIDRLASAHAVWQRVTRAIVTAYTTASAMVSDDTAAVNNAIADVLPTLNVYCARLLPHLVLPRETTDRPDARLGDLIPVSRGNRAEDLALAVRTWLPSVLNDLLGGIARAASTELEEVKYLGPVRDRPPRHVGDPDRSDANWAAGGGFAWDTLAHDADVRERVNQWLQGHPGKTGQDLLRNGIEQERHKLRNAAGGSPEAEQGATRPAWMKTPYRLVVERYISDSEIQKAVAAELYQEDETLEERRAALTADLARVYADLNADDANDRAEWQRIKRELEPWVESLMAARSEEDEARVLRDAQADLGPEVAKLLSSSEVQQEVWADWQNRWGQPALHAERRAEWFMALLKKQDTANVQELRLWDQTKDTSVALCDVGFGVSQVLPVLTLAYSSASNVVAIEQPEIHLHPALQAELADVFIESALGERQNTFILETHSEHVILRLLRRIRETTNGELPEGLIPLHPEDVQILYARPEGSGSRIVELAIDAEGEFVEPWPDGFFPERAKELF